MSGQNFKVPPLSWARIRTAAEDFRSVIGFADEPRLPVVDVLEKILDHENVVRFEVFSISDMGDAEGYTCPDGEFIRLREDVYEAACNGDGRARFTIAHEIGHWHLHTHVPLLHARSDNFVPPFRLSEPQANQYAAELLMPPKFFSTYDSPIMVMNRHGVSASAARHRLDYLQQKDMIKKQAHDFS